jgi:hypothetical protein
VPNERVETLVRTLVEHLTAFGGIPLVTVFDRPKTIAIRWGGRIDHKKKAAWRISPGG